MKFKKLITINWGVVPNGEYPFGDLTAITGETGVGKSSLGDAIQTIMGGALKNIIVYNAGQDESQNKKRNKEYRSLEGYISGEDQFRFARPNGCTGIVALTFQSSKDEPENLFTAILNISVSFEMRKGNKVPRIDDLRFLIVKSAEVFIEDFVGESDMLHGCSLLYSELAQKYGKINVIEYRGKEDFLNGLYGHLWGKESANGTHAKRAAKSFCNFINAKPVDDINSFVRNEFLEPKNMKEQVISLSEALRSLDRAKQEAFDIEAGIKLVDKVILGSHTLIDKWYGSKKDHFTYSFSVVKEQYKKIKEQNKKFVKAEIDLKQYESDIKKHKEGIEAARENINTLEAKMGSDENFKNYSELQSSLELSNQEFVKLKGSFLIGRVNELSLFRNNVLELFGRSQPVDGIYELFDGLNTVLSDISDFSFFNYFSKSDIDDEKMQSMVRSFDDSLISYSHHINTLHDSNDLTRISRSLSEKSEKNTALREKLRIKRNEIRDEIQDLESNVIHLPSDKKKDFEILKDALPDVGFSMLYEHVDINPESTDWREAIEGFLNTSRYAIIVDTDHEISALNVANDKKLGLKIIQGTKVIREINISGRTVKENSMAGLLSFTHPVAEAYILATYGNVLTVDDPDELKKSRRGVMKDCRSASGNTMSSCRLKMPRYILGTGGRQKTLENLFQEESSVTTKFNQAESERAVLRKTADLFLSVESEHKNLSSNNTHYENLSKSFEKYFQVKRKLSLMDIKSFDEIQKDIARYKDAEKSLTFSIETILKSSGIHEELIKRKGEIESNQQTELVRIETLFQDKSDEYKSICRIYKGMSDEDFIKHYDLIKEELGNRKMGAPDALEAVVINEWSNFIQYYTNRELEDSPKVQVNLDFLHRRLHDSLPIFTDLVGLSKKFIEEKKTLTQAQSFVHREKIEEANEKFERTFINDFCNTIHMHIEEGRESINSLNGSLRKHSFGSDKFAVSTLDPDPELKEYKKYFQSIHELKAAASGDSLLSAIYDDEYQGITQRLTELIKDSDKRGAELERLSDYRNYYNYDIIQTNSGNEISLSRNGKMSGGQGETSYYVIRSINLHAALRAKDMSGNALESVFMDESFSKTNEKRAKEILSYLNETMGFQIVFAMPTKHIGSFLNLDLDGYHFTKMPLENRKNGELDYEIWVQPRKSNGEEIKKLYEKEDLRIIEEIETEAKELFGW